MPTEAFRDLWDTLKRGRPWSGLVKNRRKNGDHYWVRATATPLADGAGYASVQVKPGREEVHAAEYLYKRMRNDARTRLHEGRVLTNNLLSKLISGLVKVPKLLMVVQSVLLVPSAPLLIDHVHPYCAFPTTAINSVWKVPVKEI